MMLLRGNCTVETKVALSYAFVPMFFITDKLIWVIDNKPDPYQEPSTEQPRYPNSVSHLILKYGLPEVTKRSHPILQNCHLSHLSHLSMCLYRVGLLPGLRSALLYLSFKTRKKSSWLVCRILILLRVSPYSHRGVRTTAALCRWWLLYGHSHQQ